MNCTDSLPVFTSIIIPTHRRPAVLRRCLAALSKQERLDGIGAWEVIVVDDGPTAFTREACLEAAPYLPAIRYVSQEQAGPAVARNNGLRLACGQVVLFLNDDTLAGPSLLADHARAHLSRPEPTFASVGPFLLPNSPTPSPFALWAQRDWFKYHKVSPRAQRLDFRYFYTCNVSAKKEFLLAAGGFDEAFHDAAYEDTEIGYRLHQLGMELQYLPGAIGYHLHQIDIEGAFRRMTTAGRAAKIAASKMPRNYILDSFWLGLVRFPLAPETIRRLVIPLARLIENRCIIHPIYKLAMSEAFVRGLEHA